MGALREEPDKKKNGAGTAGGAVVLKAFQRRRMPPIGR
jgi:hypothetical protein